MLHKEILTEEQVKLWPLLKLFSDGFGLVGGTAIALYIGHRRSIDFDLFTNQAFQNSSIRQKVSQNVKIDNVLIDKLGEFTITVKGVKLTFCHYPYKLNFSKRFDNILEMPTLLTLAAMKAYALGRRVKWKDYVDLYFIIKEYFSVNEIAKKGKEIFGHEFNEKLFRSQLAYFEDIDHREKINYLKGFEKSKKTIQEALVAFSLDLS